MIFLLYLVPLTSMRIDKIKNIIPPAPSILEYINARVQIDDTIKLAIGKVAKTEYLNKNDLLVKEGMVAHRIFFIQKGSARSCYDYDEKEVTSWFYREGHLITSWSSFYMQTPSFENIELTEDATILSLSYDDLQQLYRQFPKMQAFGRIMVEEQLTFLDYFFKGFNFMSAKEKYDLLLDYFPDITLRVNLGHIASFLGISQETLSRIRRNR